MRSAATAATEPLVAVDDNATVAADILERIRGRDLVFRCTSPRLRSWQNLVEVWFGIGGESGPHLSALVGGVIVHNQVQLMVRVAGRVDDGASTPPSSICVRRRRIRSALAAPGQVTSMASSGELG
jgi:hypothetical protein